MNNKIKYWDVDSIFDKSMGECALLIIQEGKEDKYVDLSKYLNGDKKVFSEYINTLYEAAIEKPNVRIFIPFKLDHGANKLSDKFTERDVVELFIKNMEVPKNIVFHRSYKNVLQQEILKKENLERIKKLSKKIKDDIGKKGSLKIK